MEKTKSVQSLKRQLTAAIAMVLVAAIALISATYAWFVANNTVTAETATISAQSNSPYLKIAKENDELTGTSITFVEEQAVSTPLYPAQVIKNTQDNAPLFQSAYAQKTDAATELNESRYDVGTADQASTATTGNAQYALKEVFKIGTTDAKAGSFKDLKVSKVEVKTGADSSTGLKDAISVLLVCGDKYAVYKASNDGTLVTKYADNKTDAINSTTSGVLAEKVGAGTGDSDEHKVVTVKAYVFYDGSQENVKTSNITNLTNCSVNITFTATPVNTAGTEVNTTNDVATSDKQN